MCDVIKNADLLVIDVRGLALGHLDDEDAEGPHIYLIIVLQFALNHFGRHPADSADLALSLLLVASQLSGIAKVSQFNLTVHRH